jgi:hypothetical protein
MPRRFNSELSIFSRKAMTAIQPVVALEAAGRNLPIDLEVSHSRYVTRRTASPGGSMKKTSLLTTGLLMLALLFMNAAGVLAADKITASYGAISGTMARSGLPRRLGCSKNKDSISAWFIFPAGRAASCRSSAAVFSS